MSITCASAADDISTENDMDLGFSITSGSHFQQLLDPMPLTAILDLSESMYTFDRSHLWRFCGRADTKLAVVVDPYDEMNEMVEDDNSIIVPAVLTDCPCENYCRKSYLYWSLIILVI